MQILYEFCDENKIGSNLREALYHHLMAKGNTAPTRSDIIKAWGEVLNETARNILAKIENDED